VFDIFNPPGDTSHPRQKVQADEAASDTPFEQVFDLRYPGGLASSDQPD
jgi:hypothetical protein